MPTRLLLGILFILVVGSSRSARSDTFPVGAHARSEYLRLRNLDPSGDAPVHAAKWVRLAEEMNGIYLKSVNTMPSRDLLFAAEFLLEPLELPLILLVPLLDVHLVDHV